MCNVCVYDATNGIISYVSHFDENQKRQFETKMDEFKFIIINAPSMDYAIENVEILERKRQ